MKNLLLIAVALLALAPSAKADISDSGNGVIGGTVTVQGNAFSVGGSTFVVNSGSITLGGPLNAAAVGIKWADGSVSTTATQGAGGAYLASTQTFTGANTFAGSLSANGGVTLGTAPNLCSLGSYARGVDSNLNATGCATAASGGGTYLAPTTTATAHINFLTTTTTIYFQTAMKFMVCEGYPGGGGGGGGYSTCPGAQGGGGGGGSAQYAETVTFAVSTNVIIHISTGASGGAIAVAGGTASPNWIESGNGNGIVWTGANGGSGGQPGTNTAGGNGGNGGGGGQGGCSTTAAGSGSGAYGSNGGSGGGSSPGSGGTSTSNQNYLFSPMQLTAAAGVSGAGGVAYNAGGSGGSGLSYPGTTASGAAGNGNNATGTSAAANTGAGGAGGSCDHGGGNGGNGWMICNATF